MATNTKEENANRESALSNVKHIDYKDVELLKKFLNPHARVLGKKRTGISTKHQRQIARAIKRARFMGLLPYVEK